MLTSFRVKKFKAFRDTSLIDLKPLTLLSGVNSAGKSSIIQALLLLKQTLESPPSLALAPGKGRLLHQSLGDNFNDFIFGRPELEKAKLVYQLRFAFDHERDVELYTGLKRLFADLDEEYPGGDLTASLPITFRWGPFGHRGRPTVRVSDLRIDLALDGDLLVRLEISPATGGMYDVAVDRDHTAPFLNKIAWSSLEIDGLSNFLPTSFIVQQMQQFLLFELEIGTEPVPTSFVRLFRDGFSAVRRDLSDEIYYLNSFREPPSQVYTTGQTAGGLLEPDGSNFAEVLWQLGDEEIEFVAPGDEVKRLSLTEMTDYVLREVLELRQSVQVRQAAADILTVEVETLGPQPLQVTLTDVGLGYNQILPVVVQGLLTPPGGLVIFEQPEIHLHPDVQAKLVKFFVGLARAGRRVLVETHSSHMIEHLCLEIARDESNWLAQNTQTLFIYAPDAAHESARIESIEITPYGEILNWPENFLPDAATLDEEILRAGFVKRKKEQEAPAE
jgi:predicted ATPase